LADRFDLNREREFAPAPAALAGLLIDNHAHMELIAQSESDDPAVDAVIADAAAVGVTRIVQVGYSLAQSRWGVRVAERFPGQVLAAVALHPNEAPIVEDLEEELAQIAELAKHPRVRALGETGLDFFRTEPALRAAQFTSFKRHIQIAKENELAVMIHDRDAHREVLDTLSEVGAPAKTVFHCYSGDEAMALECRAAGYFLSFAGTITFKNSPHLRAALKVTPLDRILVETDAPFLTPTPHRGKLNTPGQVVSTLRFMANELAMDELELAQIVTANTLAVYGEF
jgi:TatD DNase family protein